MAIGVKPNKQAPRRPDFKVIEGGRGGNNWYRKPQIWAGAAVLAIAGVVAAFNTMGGDSTPDDDPQVTTTGLTDPTVATTLPGEVTVPSIDPTVGPMETPELNRIYNQYSEQIRADGPVLLTREFFDTELQGNYELGYQIWVKNLERALNYFDTDYLTVAFNGGKDSKAYSDFAGIFGDLANHRYGTKFSDVETYWAEIDGTFELKTVETSGAIGSAYTIVTPGNVEGWLSTVPGGFIEGTSENAIIGFYESDGLMKVGPPAA